MVFPPFSYWNLYEIFGLRHSFHSLFSVPVYCNVRYISFSFSVTLSDVLVCLRLFPVPYSFMIKVYVLGGPYLLCLDFMIYIFIGFHRYIINSILNHSPVYFLFLLYQPIGLYLFILFLLSAVWAFVSLLYLSIGLYLFIIE